MPCYSKVLPFHFHSLIQAFQVIKTLVVKRTMKKYLNHQ